MKFDRIRSKLKHQAFKVTRTKVDVFICGFEKCWTSSLYTYLKNHPEIEPGIRKGLRFFDSENSPFFHSDSRPKSISEYHNCFPLSARRKRLLDASLSYSNLSSVTAIFEYNPNAKLIFLLRDPVKRAISAHTMYNIKNKNPQPYMGVSRYDPRPLQQAVVEELNGQASLFNYINKGRYAKQLLPILDSAKSLNKTENILVSIVEDDIAPNVKGWLERLCDFLEIEFLESELPRSNKGFNQNIPPELIQELQDIFKTPNRTLEKTLNRKISWA